MIKLLLALTLICLGLAAVISWQGYRIIKTANSLPVHTIPAVTQPMMISNINPQATADLQQLSVMSDLLSEYPTITVPLHTNKTEPVFHYIRNAIESRGGASRANCPESFNATDCSLDAALTTPMFRELQQLSEADFQAFQTWIDQQPATPSWQPDQPLVITRIHFEEPFVSAWPLHGSYSDVTSATAVIIGASWIVGVLLFFYLLVQIEQEEIWADEQRAKGHATQSQQQPTAESL